MDTAGLSCGENLVNEAQPGGEGGTVDASGPFGRFCLLPTDANARYLLIGTGTGVTPYRAMLPLIEQAIAERGIQVVLLFGARTPDELLYGEAVERRFKALAGAMDCSAETGRVTGTTTRR